MHPQVKSNLFLASTCWLQEGEFTFLELTGVIKTFLYTSKHILSKAYFNSRSKETQHILKTYCMK